MRNLERGALLGCGGVLVRDFFRPARRVGGGSGTKFSLLAKNGLKSAFWGVLGEFYTGWAAEPGVLGEFYTGWARRGCVPGEFSTGIARRGRERGQFCTGSGSACGIKFSLLGLLVAKAVKSSPCARKVGRNQRFGACRESFVPGGPPSRAAGRVLYRVGRRAGQQGEFCLAEGQMACIGPFSRPSPRPSTPLSCAAATRGPGGHAQPASGNRSPDPSVMRSPPHANRPPTHHAGRAVSQRMYGV